ncbi:MAG: hypothetical protein DRN37_10570 [Thermoplasmata archaeon]|nr:MAG: endonuclease [Thermoplasmatales archaeon ex4484_6]RLF54178.1 MAG: hypothetical protein DRN37_10570 [Thermoplasmata archaeon]HHD16579.1 GIY-YIG nuclease family protein [Euryarchaeota archaeon]
MDEEDPPTGPAVYLLVLEFDRPHDVSVGSLGTIHIGEGRYVYVGSAKRGLWGRVRRHLGEPERKRWHIDHISHLADRRTVFWKEYDPGLECGSARSLGEIHEGVKGFGSSDCGCVSHLFFISPFEA